jgi:hypothetical protein
MEFLGKLGDIVRNIGDKATDAIETTKLNSKISAEKTAISECMRQIGEYYYKKHQAGETGDASLTELYTAIDGHNEAIKNTQAEIARVQAENAAQTARANTPAGTSVDSSSATGEISCPSCGKANAPGTKFCCDCGGKLEIFTATAAPTDRSCPGCGAKVPAASKFCGSCGAIME